MAKKKVATDSTQNVDAIIQALNKKIGMPIAGRLKDFDLSYNIMPTGSLAVDLATGIGGLATGRMYEISGNHSAGKTTLAVNTIRYAQGGNELSLFCDAECAAEASLFDGLYINPEKLIYQRHSIGEVLLEGTEALIKSNMLSIAVIDSLATLLPEIEDAKEFSDNSKIAARAVLVGRFLQKINTVLRETNTVLILINQERVDIKASQSSYTGTVMKTTGGQAVQYFPSCKIKLFSSEAKSNIITDNAGKIIGQKVKVSIAKNRLASPRAVLETHLIFGKGFDIVRDLIAIATDIGILELKGAWYYYGGKSIAHGVEKLRVMLLEDRVLLNKLLSEVFFLFGIHEYSYDKVVEEYLNPVFCEQPRKEEIINKETGEITNE